MKRKKSGLLCWCNRIKYNKKPLMVFAKCQSARIRKTVATGCRFGECVCCLDFFTQFSLLIVSTAGAEYVRARIVLYALRANTHSRTRTPASHNSNLSVRLCVDLWCQMSHLLRSLSLSFLSFSPSFSLAAQTKQNKTVIRISISHSLDPFILFVLFVSPDFDGFEFSVFVVSSVGTFTFSSHFCCCC